MSVTRLYNRNLYKIFGMFVSLSFLQDKKDNDTIKNRQIRRGYRPRQTSYSFRCAAESQTDMLYLCWQAYGLQQRAGETPAKAYAFYDILSCVDIGTSCSAAPRADFTRRRQASDCVNLLRSSVLHFAQDDFGSLSIREMDRCSGDHNFSLLTANCITTVPLHSNT